MNVDTHNRSSSTKTRPGPHIALLISGHMRAFDENVLHLRDLTRELACDVFAHTWGERDMTAPTWRRPDFDGTHRTTHAELFSRLPFRRVQVEEQSEIDLATLFGAVGNATRPWTGAHYMIYGMHRCMQLCEGAAQGHKPYDVIIRYRFDIACTKIRCIVEDVRRVFEGRADVIMPRHNWAAALGARFDGMIVAAPSTYRRLLDALCMTFDPMRDKLVDGERFIPELLISKCAHDLALCVHNSRATIQLLRRHHITEQTFMPEPGGLFGVLRENATAYNLIKSATIDRHTTLTAKEWRRSSGLPLYLLTNGLYPLYRRLTSFVRRTTP
jgi:hypothetical protein